MRPAGRFLPPYCLWLSSMFGCFDISKQPSIKYALFDYSLDQGITNAVMQSSPCLATQRGYLYIHTRPHNVAMHWRVTAKTGQNERAMETT